MNKYQLNQRLAREGFISAYYSLSGEGILEGYCMDFSNGVWEVYYAERGRKNNLKKFTSEEDACDYFYLEISKDTLVKTK